MDKIFYSSSQWFLEYNYLQKFCLSHTCGMMSYLLRFVCFVVLAVSTLSAHESTSEIDADVGLNVKQMIQRRGYVVEEHQVITEDRYVLTMYRIPKSHEETRKNVTSTGNKPVVYLVHGLLDSSFTYVLNYRTQSLAYMLADAGYDVWLGNNRGTTWSRKHLDYSLDDPRFWDFSWEQMAEFDLPAFLNYVLQHTNQATLSYIGHSEGTMQAFAGFSMNQELAKRVSFFGALAPVAHVGNVQSPVFKFLAETYVDKLFDLLGFNEFWQRNPFIQDIIGKYGCAFVDVACDSVINALTGPSKNVNQSRIHVYVAQTPAGTSVKNVAHFAQGIRDGTFGRYDYGCLCFDKLPIGLCPKVLCKNKQVYGTFKPPSFDLSSLEYPRIGLFKGSDDWLATEKDVSKIVSLLPKSTIVFEKTVKYNHLDFTWAYNAKEDLYEDLINEIGTYAQRGYQ